MRYKKNLFVVFNFKKRLCNLFFTQFEYMKIY